MNRRDIILVAVMINVGLLIVLFGSSLKNKQEPTLAKNIEVEKKLDVVKPKTSSGVDQVARVLNQYTAKANVKEEVKPSPPVLAPPKKEVSVASVTVKKGDTLEKIARSKGTSVDGIMKSNALKDSRLDVGQILKLPSEKVVKTEKKTEVKYYIVKGGDNPWTIAHAHNIQVIELLRLNNMNEAKAKKLRPGDKLRIQ